MANVRAWQQRMIVKVDENKICLKKSKYVLIYPIWKFLRSLHNFSKFVTKYLFDKCRFWCCISNFIFRMIVKFKCICEKKNLINYFKFHFNLSALLYPLPFFHPSKNQLQFLQVYLKISPKKIVQYICFVSGYSRLMFITSSTSILSNCVLQHSQDIPRVSI